MKAIPQSQKESLLSFLSQKIQITFEIISPEHDVAGSGIDKSFVDPEV